ncbi:L-threonylcarbamoyladenylate synthase [Parerythrobacter lacustris]|uniref:Threonylcarbamoyl-AMP synthase n=1 Tax=Parerythrobacter lacustris TaxID=2969984 RepID=A0ABT1XUZ0_9SPHN|nr:L-threonylcarbamoyladenylate synthase [Parerythrobacter lacustris]MCR2834450.1 L-threonylcarbamoyladenylate synthase [Parerythrobacter lacustris]
MSGKNATETLSADAAGIARAAAILESGGLVAVPTETVYGLAARADRTDAVAKIYAAKGRPSFNPLIVHVRDAAHAERLGDLPTTSRVLAESFWPAPLTLVVPKRADADLAPAVTAGLSTVALRSPDHTAMQALLAACDFPLAAPSANRSGFVSPTTATHVAATLDGRIDLILDAGFACSEGIESTIVAIRHDDTWAELRTGPVDLDRLHEHYWGTPYNRAKTSSGIEAPGQLASHYSPGKPVRLDAGNFSADEFVIGFGGVAGDCTLSATGDLNEAAARLYDCLHFAARSTRPVIAIAPIPHEGIGIAINDRLRRAAAPS